MQSINILLGMFDHISSTTFFSEFKYSSRIHSILPCEVFDKSPWANCKQPSSKLPILAQIILAMLKAILHFLHHWKKNFANVKKFYLDSICQFSLYFCSLSKFCMTSLSSKNDLFCMAQSMVTFDVNF